MLFVRIDMMDRLKIIFHMSFKPLCTPEMVLTVLSPLNLKLPPVNPFVKELLQG